MTNKVVILEPDYQTLHKIYIESQEKLMRLTDSVLFMRECMFSQCAGNPVINSWGYNVDLSSLNTCYNIAYEIDKELNKDPY